MVWGVVLLMLGACRVGEDFGRRMVFRVVVLCKLHRVGCGVWVLAQGLKPGWRVPEGKRRAPAPGE